MGRFGDLSFRVGFLQYWYTCNQFLIKKGVFLCVIVCVCCILQMNCYGNWHWYVLTNCSRWWCIEYWSRHNERSGRGTVSAHIYFQSNLSIIQVSRSKNTSLPMAQHIVREAAPMHRGRMIMMNCHIHLTPSTVTHHRLRQTGRNHQLTLSVYTRLPLSSR